MRKTPFLLSLAGFVSAATVATSNPNATAEAKRLHAYLQNLSGQGILSGQLSMLNEATDDTTFRERYVMARDGGRMPAIYASNFGDWPMTYQDSIVRTIEHKWTKAGGQQVLMLCWHMVQPDAFEDSGYAVMSRFSATNPYPSWKVDSILKPGTALNLEYMKRMKRAGDYLKKLDSAGIPVIWRPFHENNGAYFWWGQQPRFKELWRHMYTYYTDSLHLNNLLWAYSVGGFGEGDRWIDSLYPGHAYVDILGVDIYASSAADYQPWIYQTLLAKAEGRPIGITENGMMPNVPVLKYTQPKWTFFCTWPKYEVDTMWVNDYYHPAGYSLQNSDALYTAVYGDPYTLTRDQIDFGIAPDNHVFLSTSASPPNGGTVQVVPDTKGRYVSGDVVSATAVPAAGWDFTGWSGDAASAQSPISLAMSGDKSLTARFKARLGTNLLRNGDFSSGLDGWNFSAWATGAGATGTVSGQVLSIDVTSAPSAIYGIQLTQPLSLDSGATYSLSYRAWASSPREVDVAVGEGSGSYRKLTYDTTTAGTSPKTFTYAFVDTLPSSAALRLEFELGAATGTVFLDSIRIAMTKVSASVLHRSPASRIRLSRTPEGLSWSIPEASAKSFDLQVLGVDGRQVAKFRIPDGIRQGSLRADLPRAILVARILSGGRNLGQAVVAP